MALKFENLQDKLENYAERSSIHAEEALQLMLTLCDDIRWETAQHTPVSACKIGNGDRFVNCLISLSNTLQQLYQANTENISELRRAGAAKTAQDHLRQLTNACQEAAEELSRSKNQREALEAQAQQLQKIKLEQESQKALCQRLTQEIEALQADLLSLDSLDVHQLEDKRDRLKAQLQASRNSVAALQEETSGLEQSYEQNAALLEKAKSAKNAAEEKLRQLGGERTALQESTAALDGQIREQVRYADTLRQQKAALEQHFDRQQAENRQFEANDLNPAQVKLRSAQAEYAGLAAERDKVNAACAELQQKIQDVNSQNAAVRAGIDALQTELDQLKSQTAQLEEQNRQLCTARQEYMESLRKMQEETIGLQLEADNLKSSNQAYRTNILEKAREEYEHLQGEQDSLLREKEQLDAQYAAKQAQIQDISAQMNRIQTEIGIMQVQAEKAAKQAEELGAQKESLDGQISKVSQYCKNTQQYIQELEQQLRDMDAEKMEEMLTQQQRTLEEACERCRNQQAQQASLDEAIREKQRQITVADAELGELQRSEAQLQQELKRLNNLLYPLGEASYQEQVNKLKTQLEILQGVRDRLERDSVRLRKSAAFSVDDILQAGLVTAKNTLDALQKSILDYTNQWQHSL